ncbi:YceI family protein [Sanguibacter inulinus]|jgi:polyisoprenoid-binding protein YceI|uniref:YceI family protein n=1 Tax=Sanguibacter inulinus TaxID=60922 RepID=A0A853ETX9_9MICO|nr:YceI family protein [Sanguibacter inulinus]MBF0722822.1 YceI family protein [Sanguibacter inulinus]NYS93967.1 YceI family protein [Sanguibacter inulinus]
MKHKLVIAVVALLALAGIAVGGSALYAKIENDKAPDALALSTPTATTDGASPGLTEQDLAGTWTVSDGSQAGYRVAEVLNGQDVTVVGRTSDVEGTVTIDGTSLSAADVTVSMTTITTDNSNRDGQFLDILKTSEFPTATFTLTEPVDVSGVTEGTTSVQATGELTVAGVSAPVVVALDAQTTATGVEVSGSIPVTFSDFGVDAPDLGFVKVEDTGTVEMLLTLAK